MVDGIRFKIFYGNHTLESAAEKLNRWLDEHPDIKLVDYQYQQTRMGDHSICIAYLEDAK